MLPTTQRQEALSRAYVRAVAAQAGMICGELGQDFGIDMYLRTVPVIGQRYIDMGNQLDLQLKSSTRPHVSEAEIVHDLEVRAYDVLRAFLLGCPRILVPLVLPEDESLWLSQSVDELILRRCAYWMSLRGAPATSNQASIRISIPSANVFCVETVRTLMQQLSKGTRP
jgi:hypothetical protein